MPTDLPKVFVIVLNFNGAETLAACLSSVFQSDYQNLEVLVVDNDSKDGSFEQARKNYSRAHFIKNPKNVGFAKGNNVGIRWALEKFTDYVFILNNDAVIEKNTISSLVQTAEHEDSVGIVSPLILDADNKIWFAGGKIIWNRMRTVHLFDAQAQLPYATEYLTGCAMLIKKAVFKKVGIFDERFFLYYEDADLSVRTKNAGFDLLVVPKAKIQHLEQSNSKNDSKLYWLVLSGLLFFQIHSSLRQKLWLFPYLQLRKVKNFYDAFFLNNNDSIAVRRAYKDFKKI